MTLDEAIKCEEELADGIDRIKQIKAVTLEECRRAKEHRQLAEWLKDYQRLLEEQHVDDAKKHFEIICKLSQALGFPYSFVEEKIKETEKALLKASLQGPFGDTVSRQAVLDFISDNYRRWFINDEAFMQCMNGIKVMMSTPKMQEVEE